jgi:hypothetical protein
MTKVFKGILLAAFLVYSGAFAYAIPVDLSTFTAGPSVSVSSGTVTFTEDINYAAIYFFNDHFAVANDVTNLSFDYSFQKGNTDSNNYFQFEFNYNFDPATLQVTSDGIGHFVFDLVPYRGMEVSLAWGLCWGGALDYSGTVATLSNIDLGTTVPSPASEPFTLILLGSGLVGLIGLGRRRMSE